MDWDGGELSGGTAPIAKPLTRYAVELGDLEDTDQSPISGQPGDDSFGPPLDLASEENPRRASTATENSHAHAESAFRAPSHEDQPIALNLTLEQMVAEKKGVVSESVPESVVPDPTAFISIPGRIWEGRLRQTPRLHTAIGLVLALAIGYLIVHPVQRRSQMRIEFLQQEAARERARGLEEANEEAARFEGNATNESTKAFFVVALLWLGIGGGLFAVYNRFT